MHGEKEVFSWDAGGRGSDRIVFGGVRGNPL